MPTYLYECSKCGEIMEIFHSMSYSEDLFHDDFKELSYNESKECNGKLKKIIGKGSGIIFKGTGFYDTDYKKKKG